ncbi:ABC transporter ATP-binding protein [Gorillibacterium massiliense]|uniref:ABC transporter ATP-binding protein n=1 Tax=Gorillibacterium massiliense TaxID=1280390 RepID=UPI0004BB599C|nr:ABC transporter ATP-binding protein [Gorillibacterium massiliense]
MTRPLIECERIAKQYGRTVALDNFSVSIPEGKIVGILGPNGCGKSSFFRMVTGLTKPDSGRVQVLGREPGWQTNKEIAYLPDRAHWYPSYTVNQLINWGKTFLPAFDPARAERLAEFMEVDLEAKIGGMSRGQEARVLLILCLARDVPLIILDEPFAGIDVISRESIVAAIIDMIEERQQSILISTHDIQEVEGLFDYIVMLDHGKVIWSGESEDLRAEHGSLHQVFRSIYKKEWKA